MSTRAYIIHEDKKISFDPDEAIPEGDACDHCGNMIPFTSGDVMTGKFRIGSKGKHEFTVHQTCAAGMLENICREELHFLSRRYPVREYAIDCYSGGSWIASPEVDCAWYQGLLEKIIDNSDDGVISCKVSIDSAEGQDPGD